MRQSVFSHFDDDEMDGLSAYQTKEFNQQCSRNWNVFRSLFSFNNGELLQACCTQHYMREYVQMIDLLYGRNFITLKFRILYQGGPNENSMKCILYILLIHTHTQYYDS